MWVVSLSFLFLYNNQRGNVSWFNYKLFTSDNYQSLNNMPVCHRFDAPRVMTWTQHGICLFPFSFCFFHICIEIPSDSWTKKKTKQKCQNYWQTKKKSFCCFYEVCLWGSEWVLYFYSFTNQSLFLSQFSVLSPWLAQAN